MEVHPPEHPIQTPRDFFLHLFTITVGLLIALALEGLVEAAHHRHLLHQAETNLHGEILANRETLAGDDAQLGAMEGEISADLALLSRLKAHQPAAGSLNFAMTWNGMQAAAWDSARDTGAIALMPYDDARGYSLVYEQQALLNDQATVFIRQMFRSGAPRQGRPALTDMTPGEVDATIVNLQEAMADLQYLRMLGRNLERIYNSASTEL